jgi:enoyl-CoA hydratase/carnithine racemase
VKEGWRAPGEELTPFDQEDPGEWLGPKSNKVWKPLIVAVHGMAAGGAFYWLNEADIVICSEDATFFDPHLKFGKISAVEPIGAMGRIPLQEITRMVLLADTERYTLDSCSRARGIDRSASPRGGPRLYSGDLGGAEPAARPSGDKRAALHTNRQAVGYGPLSVRPQKQGLDASMSDVRTATGNRARRASERP